MAHVISVVNQKGGVGKTTTSLNLAAFLADAGKFVLLIDLDPQANATSGLGIDYASIEAGVYEGMLGLRRLRELILPTIHEGLKIIPATPALSGAAIELVNAEEREHFLRKALLEVRNDYDYVIIDNPPSLGLLTVNALTAAESVLIPVQAEYYALEGLGQLLGTVDLVRDQLNPDLKVMGAVITMYDTRTRLSKEVLQELYKFFPDKIFRSVIPRSIRLAEAPSFGKTILGYDPSSKAAKAYERLARELLFREQNRLSF
ncbi:MAG: sporulation initiation inhibitor protein Soj [Candidatus Uhrbacteria bacterium GW2011_GWF2_41_16]|jgi:chromosome partitioning protein|uniref:Sporulation initiation inhibitor protein Soj n=2 Tax=Candidatus Uhriibacteriota TaxID=1752732 RepID=A0A0G0VCY5_9BACT|nr:MAG: sporulation initiation inhibitor protein Soj [Candidatus Uhrbacteria bacterium GW2011_GWA2_41_10]KKR87809.1 MAG: sporulation initiation inhibitor protein Soj [Candidatus Uhrbacteria bacterium GW2011_GWC2_41_11]KKR98748.1 MAG: sporulation initiation inhibitor protein Soj [Candidatus Uhrbacteria bacterium GW2011_GWF2_41_16]